MSPDLQTTLFRAAHHEAGGDPTLGPDLAAIRRRGGQLRRRRRAVTAAATAAAVPALAAAVILALPDSPGPQSAPPAGTSPAGTSPVVTITVIPMTEGAWKAALKDGRTRVVLNRADNRVVAYMDTKWRTWCEVEVQEAEQGGADDVDPPGVLEPCVVAADDPDYPTAPVATDVVVIAAPDSDPPVRKSMSWLRDFVATTSNDYDAWTYWLTVEDGVITKIEQVNPELSRRWRG
jgi:hypothetical protein